MPFREDARRSAKQSRGVLRGTSLDFVVHALTLALDSIHGLLQEPCGVLDFNIPGLVAWLVTRRVGFMSQSMHVYSQFSIDP